MIVVVALICLTAVVVAKKDGCDSFALVDGRKVCQKRCGDGSTAVVIGANTKEQRTICQVTCDTTKFDEIKDSGFVVACAKKCGANSFRPENSRECRAQCKAADGSYFLPASTTDAKGRVRYSKCPVVCSDTQIAVQDEEEDDKVRCVPIVQCEAGKTSFVGTDGKTHCTSRPMCAEGQDQFVDGGKVKCAKPCPTNMKRMVLDKKGSRCVSECPTGFKDEQDRKRKDGGKCLPPLDKQEVEVSDGADNDGNGVPDCCRADHVDDDRKRDSDRLPCPAGTVCPPARCREGSIQIASADGSVVCKSKRECCADPTLCGELHCNDTDEGADENTDDDDDVASCCDDRRRKRGDDNDSAACVGVVCPCDKDEVNIDNQCVDVEKCTVCGGSVVCPTGVVCDDK